MTCYSFGRLLPAYEGDELMLHQNGPQAAKVAGIKEQLVVTTKRKLANGSASSTVGP